MTSRRAGFPASGGYAHRDYAASLVEFGRPRELPNCAGWILERGIPGSSAFDAMGCYPLFSCRDWSALPDDLEALRGQVVSLSVVLDPFGRATPEFLQKCFPDICIPFGSSGNRVGR